MCGVSRARQAHGHTQGLRNWLGTQPHSGVGRGAEPDTKPHSWVEWKGRASHTPGWRGRASRTATLRGGGQGSVGGQEGRLAFGEAPAPLLLKNVIHISATKLFCSSGGQPLARVPFLRPPRSTFDPTGRRWAQGRGLGGTARVVTLIAKLKTCYNSQCYCTGA